MAAGTSVTDKNPRGLVVLGGYFTLNPGSIAAAGREEQTVAVPAAKVGDLAMRESAPLARSPSGSRTTRPVRSIKPPESGITP
jgi:hypothetical protein